MGKVKDWDDFQLKVSVHISSYANKQYGHLIPRYDESVLNLKKYVERIGKNARPGEQPRDFLKIAHYSQLAFDNISQPELVSANPLQDAAKELIEEYNAVLRTGKYKAKGGILDDYVLKLKGLIT